MVLVAIAGSYVASVRVRFQDQARAVADLERRGARVQILPRRSWLRFAFGSDIYYDVHEVHLYGCKADPKVVEDLASVFTMQQLYADLYPLADADLSKIAPTTRLAVLSLRATKISDRWLDQARGLEDVESLSLIDTAITDRGLREIAALKGLKQVYLNGTKTTYAGLRYLRTLPQLRDVDLGGTSVSWREVEALAQLRSLRRLCIRRIAISDKVSASLAKRLPGVELNRDDDLFFDVPP